MALMILAIAAGLAGLIPDPHDPKAALATMHVPKGFVVQQVASEPLVKNPTNMDVDERGRVWVTESPN